MVDAIKPWATVIGVAVAAASLVYTAYNARLTLKTNRARFWLELRDRFHRFDDVHRKLRQGGSWSGDAGPETNEEWVAVEAYMGLFEHCELMLSDRLIDARTFNSIYEYRLRNLLSNRRIVKRKLVDERAGWKVFLRLVGRVGLSGLLPNVPLHQTGEPRTWASHALDNMNDS